MLKRIIGRCPTQLLTGVYVVFLLATGHATFVDEAMARQESTSLPAAVAALLPEAKREEELTVFGQTLNPSQVASLSEAMSAFYGFPVKLNMIAGLHTSKSVEVVEAVKNGVPSGMDVFWTTTARIETLQRGGVLAPFDWTTELGIDPGLKWGDYGLRSHDGLLTNVFYNTDLVRADQAPKSYEDLLDPKWKGRIAMPRSPSPWVNLSYAMGEEKTTQLLTKLMQEQKARILPRYPDVVARVVNGEFPVGIGVEAFSYMARNAPIAHADLDMIVIVPWAFTLTKDARHPTLAKLWGYWATTPQGQKTLDRVHRISSIMAKDTTMSKFANGKKAYVVSYAYTIKNEVRLAKKYGRIMGVVR